MIKYCFSFTNRQSDRMTESNAETLSMNILFRKARWLSYTSTYSWVHVSSDEALFHWAVVSLKSCMITSQSLTYTLRMMLWKKKCQQQKNALKCCKMCKTRWCNDDKTQLMLRQSTIIKNISLSFLMLMI